MHFKVKMLTKELELVRVRGEKTKDELEGSETTVDNLEKQLKQKDWELTDQQSMHRAKEAEMEAEVEQLRSAFSKAQDRFQHKHAELDRYAKEKEQALVAAKEVCIACENIHFSSLFATRHVSRRGTSVTQRQKFHTDDIKSVQNPVRSADWWTE